VDILHRIGVRLGELAATQEGVAVVAAPLLGTGAGGVPLVPAVQAVVDGFRLAAPSEATLSLCAPRRNSFRSLETWHSSWRVKLSGSPRVFLSYNQSTQASWVSGLHEFLKSQGVNAVVDRWELKANHGLEILDGS
jgi:hypothetical protein